MCGGQISEPLWAVRAAFAVLEFNKFKEGFVIFGMQVAGINSNVKVLSKWNTPVPIYIWLMVLEISGTAAQMML